MKKIFTPINIGPMKLKNRMAVAPSVTYAAGPTGEVTQRQVDMYEARAKGGFGLVQVEATTIRDDGKAFPCFLSIDHPKFLPGLSQIVEKVHLHGAKVSIQLLHTGRNAQKEFIGTDPVAPSDKMIWRDKPRVLSTGECEEMIGFYAKSARMAKEVGFDGVSFHGALGHLPAQFLSPLTNDRTDKYGQDRSRFVVEMIQACREAVGPEVALIYRGSVQEFVAGGLSIDDWLDIAVTLEKAGIDCIDVYPGLFEDIIEATLPLYMPEGFYKPFAEKIKQAVNIPVMMVGKLMNANLAEKMIDSGVADLVSYCRSMFADPSFPKKMLEGRNEDIRKCCACDRCVGDGFSGRMTECSINPEFQHEGVFGKIKHTSAPKKVMVIGGGVGGMEAARVAAAGGHQVVLFEKEQRLGGLISTISKMPRLYMRELNYVVEWQARQLEKEGVQLELGQEASVEDIKSIAPDVLFVAVGSESSEINIPGAEEHTQIVHMEDYLQGRVKIAGENVVVLGACHGTEVAVSLAKEGKKVTIIDEAPHSLATAPYLVKTVIRYIALQKYVYQEQVKVNCGVKIIKIVSEGIIISNLEHTEELVPAECIISAIPRKSRRQLGQAIKAEFGDTPELQAEGMYEDVTLEINGKKCSLFEIGDCIEPRTMKEAIHAAYQAARSII